MPAASSSRPARSGRRCASSASRPSPRRTTSSAASPGEYLWDEPYGYNYAAFLRNAGRPRRRRWNGRRSTSSSRCPRAATTSRRTGSGTTRTLPANLRKYGASDYAVTAGGGDFTEHGVAGVDSKGDLYLIDWWYGQTQTDVWIERLPRPRRAPRAAVVGRGGGPDHQEPGPVHRAAHERARRPRLPRAVTPARPTRRCGRRRSAAACRWARCCSPATRPG